MYLIFQKWKNHVEILRTTFAWINLVSLRMCTKLKWWKTRHPTRTRLTASRHVHACECANQKHHCLKCDAITQWLCASLSLCSSTASPQGGGGVLDGTWCWSRKGPRFGNRVWTTPLTSRSTPGESPTATRVSVHTIATEKIKSVGQMSEQAHGG